MMTHCQGITDRSSSHNSWWQSQINIDDDADDNYDDADDDNDDDYCYDVYHYNDEKGMK